MKRKQGLLAMLIVTSACTGCLAGSPLAAPPDLPPAPTPTYTPRPTYGPTTTLALTPSLTLAAYTGEALVPPEEVGLAWSECRLAVDFPDGLRQEAAEECFGRPAPSLTDEERRSRVTGPSERLELAVGADSYHVERVTESRYTLYLNDAELASLEGGMGAAFPNVALAVIDGRWAWEFLGWDFTLGEPVAAVLYDGGDLRQLYDLDAAYRPYSIDGRLIFIGRQDGRYFVVYDGQRIGTPFVRILIAHCCGLMPASVRFGDGRYVFWGLRDGQAVVVEIAVEK
jgi:hypothetical protein